MDAISSLRWATGPVLLIGLLWWESLAPFFVLFKNGWRDRVRHGLRNVMVALLNSGITALAFTGLWAAAASLAQRHSFGLANWAGLSPWPHAVAVVLLFDVWTYSWHRLNHTVPVLWRFHRTHHSDFQMDVTTASRFHFGEILGSNFLRIPLIILIGAHLWELALYEALLLAVIQFHHANIGLPLAVDKALRCVIVTPAMHKVHHSREQLETDSNYSSLLSFWDRLFRSFRLRSDANNIQFGLHGFDAPEFQTFVGLLRTPVLAKPLSRTSHLPDLQSPVTSTNEKSFENVSKNSNRVSEEKVGRG